MCMLASCRDGKGCDVEPSDTQIDTALVLRTLHQSAQWRFDAAILCANKKGELIDFTQSDKYKFSSVGDTVIIVRDKRDASIIRNLTIENKIKAFARQK